MLIFHVRGSVKFLCLTEKYTSSKITTRELETQSTSAVWQIQYDLNKMYLHIITVRKTETVSD